MRVHLRSTRFTISAISALALSACSSSPAPPAPTHAVTGTTHYAGSQLAFDYPAAWLRYAYREDSSFSSAIVFLSTDRLHDPCTTTPDSVSCTSPIARLGPGGVLVEWTANGFPRWTLQARNGTPTTIATRPAKVRTETPGDCMGLSAQVTVTAYIERAPPDNWYQMLACVNGPNVGATERQLMTMLATLRLIQP